MTRLQRVASMGAVLLTVVAFAFAFTSGAAGARTQPAATKLTKLWTTRLVGPGTAPVVADGEVFVTAVKTRLSSASDSTGSGLYAFAATCPPAPARCENAQLWVHGYPTLDAGRDRYATALTAAGAGNGNVFVGTNQIGNDEYNGTEQAFVAASGSSVFSTGQGGTSTPTVSGGLVYSNWQFACCEGADSFQGTEALNASTGAPLFTAGFVTPTSAPAVGAGNLFVGAGSALEAFDASGTVCVPPPSVPPSLLQSYLSALGFPEACNPLWSGSAGGTITGSAVVADGHVYVGASDGVLYAFPAAGCESATCAPDWTASTGGAITTTVAVSATTVFVSSSNGVLSAFPLGGCGSATCVPEWTATVGGDPSAPTVAGSVVYVTSTNHELVAILAGGCGAATCGPSWQAKLHAPSDTAPAVGNGLVFATDTHHDLYAFRQP